MPTLDFKGKSFIYTHHLGVPYRELLVVPGKSCAAAGRQPDLDDNLILHGDNLEALKALLPRYAGRVDCIYIDPPYNTGTEGWCYNDKVNSPLMREWLKKEGNPVEREDLQRHDKWPIKIPALRAGCWMMSAPSLSPSTITKFTACAR